MGSWPCSYQICSVLITPGAYGAISQYYTYLCV
uniref:Uncharacterized protein n=1 Tax=Arundo donax TaxID=35708 RepID=A0A0A8YAP2_ARUDO